MHAIVGLARLRQGLRGECSLESWAWRVVRSECLRHGGKDGVDGARDRARLQSMERARERAAAGPVRSFARRLEQRPPLPKSGRGKPPTRACLMARPLSATWQATERMLEQRHQRNRRELFSPRPREIGNTPGSVARGKPASSPKGCPNARRAATRRAVRGPREGAPAARRLAVRAAKGDDSLSRRGGLDGADDESLRHCAVADERRDATLRRARGTNGLRREHSGTAADARSRERRTSCAQCRACRAAS